MNDRQRNREERGGRVEVYLDAAAADFPEGSKGFALTARLKELRAKVVTLELSRANSARQRRQGAERRDQARKTLRQLVKTVWDTYRTVARDSPDLKGLFESPSRSNNDQALATTARSYAVAAAPHVALFNDYGLAPTFLEDLRVQADNLESHVKLQNAGAGAGVNKTAAVEEVLRELDEVIERLNTLVRNKFRDDPAKLAAWESVSRLPRTARSRPASDDKGAPPTTPPANT